MAILSGFTFNFSKLNGFKMPKKYLCGILLLPFIYCAFVLCFVWWHCYKSPFQSGVNGQLDAYRHTLASAVVAYTTSPKVVALITHMMERKSHAGSLMDRHNNYIGAQIGAKASSLNEVCESVALQISQGTVNATDKNQTTWLPREYWRDGLLW